MCWHLMHQSFPLLRPSQREPESDGDYGALLDRIERWTGCLGPFGTGPPLSLDPFRESKHQTWGLPWKNGRLVCRTGELTFVLQHDGQGPKSRGGNVAAKKAPKPEKSSRQPAGRSQGPASYFPSIEQKYGRPIEEWQKLIRSSPLVKHMDLVNWLKNEFGMGHGHANALVAYTLQNDES